jgi:NAD(P)-dependent dehydrogenase (short-subunit alcohol dehydrogenase family)
MSGAAPAGRARLTGRVALVFGAGSSGPGLGNGKAAAIAYAREGASVVCVDVSEAAAAETAGLVSEEGGTAVADVADVTRGADVEAVVKRALGRFDRIDVLHNNVGIGQRGGPVELSEEAWHRVVDTNLTSVFLTTKYVLPVMVRQRRGVVTNISSVASIRYGGYPMISYAATKAAVNQFTVCLALQYARQGIRANAILPGFINTPMIVPSMEALSGGNLEAALAFRDRVCPTGKMGEAWDVAYAAVYLASDEAKYVTGACLVVDGGLSGTTHVSMG